MVFRGTYIVVTPEFPSDVLRVPKVVHSDYPSHPHLHTISHDELASLFCEKAMVWGDFVVMTFVLTPWSHYY